MDVVLGEEFDSFFERPLAVFLGSTDAALIPEAIRALGVRRVGDKQVRVLVNREAAARTLSNLRDNGQASISAASIADFETFQIKGRLLRVHENPGDDDRALAEATYARLMDAGRELIGLPDSALNNLRWVPDLAIEVSVEDVFVQTPGPRAGRRYGEDA